MNDKRKPLRDELKKWKPAPWDTHHFFWSGLIAFIVLFIIHGGITLPNW